MIVILCEKRHAVLAREIAGSLTGAFGIQPETAILTISSNELQWPSETSWDDVLVVLFDSSSNYPQEALPLLRGYLAEWKDLWGHETSVFPIALNGAQPHPPSPIDHLEAISYANREREAREELVLRVGACLGLRVTTRGKNTIFLSYRQVDGEAIAHQVKRFLEKRQYLVFLDKAKADDNEPMIRGGEIVDLVIKENLEGANLVLLIDTPEAPKSQWIRDEIDWADASCIPVLPVHCRARTDLDRGTRFPALRGLGRYIEALYKTTRDALFRLEASALPQVIDYMERFLSDVYQKRRMLPFRAMRAFKSRGYTWEQLERRKLLFRSRKSLGKSMQTSVLSHCSVLTPGYVPALRIPITHVVPDWSPNYKFFIYGGEISLPDTDHVALRRQARLPDNDPVIVHIASIEGELRYI